MIRRKLTLKRVDPWSVLKFGFVVNVALLLIGLLASWILWVTIRRLGLIDQFCGSVGTIVLDLQECSVNGGNIFRTLLFLGVLGVVVQTGIVVFGAFLYNLISDLTGGLTFSFLDESGDATLTSSRRAQASEERSSASGSSSRPPPGGSSSSGSGRGAVGAGAAAGGAATRASSGGSSPSSGSVGSGPATQSTGGSSSASTPRSASAPSSSGNEARPPTPPQGQAGPHADGSTGSSQGERSREEVPRDGRSDEDGEEPRPRSSGGSLWGDPSRSRE